jgi:hypothetical protein
VASCRSTETLLGERVRDLVQHVDTLGTAAVLPGVEHGTGHGAARSVVEIGVGAHDHGVVASELERAGDELATARLGDAPTGVDAAGEVDLVDARLDERRARLAVTEDDLDDVRGQTCAVEQLLDERAAEGRHLGGLHDDRVARHQRLDRRIEGQDERTVPRRDHPDHAEGPVVHFEPLGEAQQAVEAALLGAQEALGVLGVVGEGIAGGEDVDHQRFHAWLAGLAHDDVDELVLAVEQQTQRPAEVVSAGVEAQRLPHQLRLAGPLDGGLHLFGGRGFEVADVLERGGVLEPVAAGSALGGVDGVHDGHCGPPGPFASGSWWWHRGGELRRADVGPANHRPPEAVRSTGARRNPSSRGAGWSCDRVPARPADRRDPEPR